MEQLYFMFQCEHWKLESFRLFFNVFFIFTGELIFGMKSYGIWHKSYGMSMAVFTSYVWEFLHFRSLCLSQLIVHVFQASISKVENVFISLLTTPNWYDMLCLIHIIFKHFQSFVWVSKTMVWNHCCQCLLTLHADNSVVSHFGMGDGCSFLHMALIELIPLVSCSD